jgi:hypothetical protein
MILLLNVLLTWFVFSVPLGRLAGRWLELAGEESERRERIVFDACLYPGGRP